MIRGTYSQISFDLVLVGILVDEFVKCLNLRALVSNGVFRDAKGFILCGHYAVVCAVCIANLDVCIANLVLRSFNDPVESCDFLLL